MIANRSPPTPSFIGAIRPIIAFVATAPSTALPPLSRIDAPTWEASTDSEATMPPFEMIIDRDCERSCAQAPDTTAKHRMAQSAVTTLFIKLLPKRQRFAETIALPRLAVERA